MEHILFQQNQIDSIPMRIPVKRSEAIKKLLNAKTHPDLAALYTRNMEVQYNVAQDNGERVEQDYKGRAGIQSYTDGLDRWSAFRIPKQANTDPVDNDCDVHTDLYTHAEGIGMTGWDWHNRQSHWVAYDFDALTGHSEKHLKKLTDIELQNLKDVVAKIPWVTIRLSTSGKGIHLYVFLEPVTTANHTEHAALARAILGYMASLTGFDFQSKVDTCGGNMWVWHRKMTGTDGLKLIKQGERLKDIPANWKDHVRVVTGNARKTLPEFITSNVDANPALVDLFEEVTAQKTRIPLDQDHQKLIKWLHDKGACAWWDQDHHMLVTHTVYLQEAHTTLQLRGVFKTNAKGENYGADHNCFAYPLKRGGWVVRRYTPGVAEEPTWDQDGKGWTRSYLNRESDLPTACRAFGGKENKSGGFIFQKGEIATKAAHMLGIDLDLPVWALNRETMIKPHKDNKIFVAFSYAKEVDLPDEVPKWLQEGKNWTRIFDGNATPQVAPEVGNYDDAIRHILSSGNTDLGWLIRSEREWVEEPKANIKDFLGGQMKLKPSQVIEILGSAVARPWKIVCRPFEEEYPRSTVGREWNRKAPQLRFKPSKDENLAYPTWLKILDHCGKSLDAPIKNHVWCKSNGILKGSDYLKLWMSSLLQEPLQPLPYLFFYGPQDSGKSIFYESIHECLITSGVVRADNALINPSGFNAELEHSVLCVIEETDMSKSRLAYGRIKDWVTARLLPVHPKGQTPYDVVNSTHWVHTANDYRACPIMSGDTRITMCFVDALTDLDKIPKKQMLMKLEKEAPDYIAALLNLPIPDSNDRLNVPVIESGEKIQAQEATMTILDEFIKEHCYRVEGRMVQFSEFYDRFIAFLPYGEGSDWSRIKVGRELPPECPRGKVVWPGAGNVTAIGNLTLDSNAVPSKKLVCRNDKLVPEE